MKCVADDKTKKKIESSLYYCYNTKSEKQIFKPYTHYTYISSSYQFQYIINYMMELNCENEIPYKTYKTVKYFTDSMYFAEMYSSRELIIDKF